MSHYTVGVIIKKERFDEAFNLITGLENAEDTVIDKMKRATINHILNTVLEPFDENKEVEPYLSTSMENIEQEFEEIKSYKGDDNFYIDLREKYKNATLDDFIKGFYQQDYNEEGLLSTYNPNSKWDWYVIGGRWNGCLPIKNKEVEQTDDSYNDSNDFAQIKDIAFTIELTETQIKEYTEKYNTLITEGTYLKPEYYQEKYPTLDAYLNEQKSFSTYALLTPDGEWHEPGEMGWFGVSSATPKDQASFKNTYKELIENQDPEDYFVLVDCHI